MPKIAGKEIPYEKQPSFQGQNPAVKEANKLGQELKYIPLEGIESEFPTSDATLRSEKYQLGGAVRPPTAPSMQPSPIIGGRGGDVQTLNPSAPQYKKGGKVKK